MIPRVKIMMSTYNGDKYLQEQLDSLLWQKGVQVDIDIRDDGSKDKTVEIIESYKLQYPNIHIKKGDNVGPCKSFINLLYEAGMDFDFYAFSDQDDIWDEDKLLSAVSLLDDNVDKPQLYYSALHMFNTFSGYTEEKVNSIEFTFAETLIQSQFPGCTMVFNNSAMKLICGFDSPKCALMHDLFVMQLFMATGNQIIYDRTSHINYRIHGSNVSVKSRSILKEVKRYFRILRTQKGLRYESALELYRVLKGNINPNYEEKLQTVLNYKKSIKNKICFINMIKETKLPLNVKIEYCLAAIIDFY